MSADQEVKKKSVAELEKNPAGQDEGPERESWGNHCEFFLSSLGLAVGLGNVWRFPYVCYVNGGGTFLVPYLLMLFFVGIPTLFMEQSLGQYTKVGANKVFDKLAPLFKGLGYAQMTYRFMLNVYYVVICAWALFYLFAGFTSTLPWGRCDDGYDWHTRDCFTPELEAQCVNDHNGTFTWYDGKCTSMEEYCKSHMLDAHNLGFSPDGNGTCINRVTNKTIPKEEAIAKFATAPAEDYWNGYVLGMNIPGQKGVKHSWSDYGSLKWELCLCLLLAWILILLSMIKGLQSYGKIAYIITLSPYFVLTALLIYTAMLPGAVHGMEFFIKPDWTKIGDPLIWANAASQILFSLSVGFGSQLALSTYNQFDNNTQRDAILIGICNSLTSIFAGVVVFGVLGYIAHQSHTDVADVVKSGIGLAFITYPSAVLTMWCPPLWSFLFFFMLINLALSTMCGGFQTILAFVFDEWPQLQKHRLKLVTGFCVVYFLLGLTMCTDGGILLFTVFDKRCTASLLVLIFLETVAVAWVYGADKFIDNINEMGMTSWGLGSKNGFLRWVWKFLFMFLVPAVLAVIAVLAWVRREPLDYDGKQFPESIEGLGWVIELGPMILVLIFPIVRIVRLRRDGFSWSDVRNAMIKSVPLEK